MQDRDDSGVCLPWRCAVARIERRAIRDRPPRIPLRSMRATVLRWSSSHLPTHQHFCRNHHESRTVRSRGVGRSPARDPLRRAPAIRRRGRRGRHLLPARGRAPRDAAQLGAGSRRLSRRARARDAAHAARSARLPAAALLAAAPDRGDLHARSPEPRPLRGRRRARRLAVRAQVSQGGARPVARHLRRRVRVRQRRPADRRADLQGPALRIRERADRAAAAAAAASAVLVRLVEHHRRDLGGRARHAFRQPRPDRLRQAQHRRVPRRAGEARRPAETDAEAKRWAKPAMDRHLAHLNWLRVKHGATAVDTRFNTPRGANFEESVADGSVIAGTPQTVLAEIEKQTAELGINYLLTYLFLGTMSLAEALRSLELFRTEVMPKLARL